MKKEKVIIIGGGISGLSAAYNLRKKNIDFKMITEDIGGRIYTSKNGNVQYGAYYVMDIYNHTREFARLGRKIKPTELIFHKRGKGYSILQPSFIRYIPQTLRLIKILYKFKRHYSLFKKNCCTEEQSEVIKNDPYLYGLYKTNADKFIREHHIVDVVHRYMEEVLHGTTFTSIDKLNAFTFLQFSLPLVVPIYEFILDKNQITKKFESDIIYDSVHAIKKDGDHYIIKTKQNEHVSSNIIVATPPHISQKFLSLSEIKGSVEAYMFHIIGQAKEQWRNGYCNLFSDENDMLAIAYMPDHSCLFYSKNQRPDFEKYFYEYKIVEKMHWNPAFNLQGSVLWKSKIDDGLLLIGDHNVCGIEDSYITGLFAANYIENRLK